MASDHLPVVVDYRLPRYEDCNADGSITVFDLNCTSGDNMEGFLVDAGFILGDVNADGLVSFADFLVLSSNFNQECDYTDGDFDKSGKVAFPDFLILARDFSSGSPAAVPEPPGLGTFLLIVALAIRKRPGNERERSDTVQHES